MAKRPKRKVHQESEAPSKTLQARTPRQDKLISAIRSNPLVFATGSAGTGKTFVCTTLACEALRKGLTERVIITRPALEAGESLGFLPGELKDKYAPYLEPFMWVFEEWLGKSHTEYLIKAGRIAPKPLAFMRGVTFRDAWVILDEAQNTTPVQMKMFLSRMGENAKMLVTGDPSQKDIRGTSGLQDALDRLRSLPGVASVQFDREDVVRHSLVQQILEAYEI